MIWRGLVFMGRVLFEAQGTVMKRRIALTAMLALVASMFGAVPSRAADLVLTFPTADTNFIF